MHTYRKSEATVWTVGYWRPKQPGDAGFMNADFMVAWQSLKDFGSEEDAAAYVNFLNGGEGYAPPG